jgi:hypothetical protein
MRWRRCDGTSNHTIFIMNESEFEAELRKVQPAKVSMRLAERIERDLESAEVAVLSDTRSIVPVQATGIIVRETPGRGWSIWSGLCWAVGGAAAAVLILLTASHRDGDATTKDAPSIDEPMIIAIDEEPDQSVEELIASEDEGLVYDAEVGVPQRQLRVTYLERHTWTNSESGAVIEVEVPHEDIVLMPVAMQ